MTSVSLSFAHEKRTVADKYEFVVGFVSEPAFSGQMNGVDLRVLKEGLTVEGLEDKLKVTVIREDQETTLSLSFKGKYKEPGRYSAFFLPTKPGKYIFRIQGEIDGVAIDEKFESGAKFHDVEDIEPLKFP